MRVVTADSRPINKADAYLGEEHITTEISSKQQKARVKLGIPETRLPCPII